MEDITLMTKILQPQRREAVLTRQRLLNRLYDMIDHKAILISAPAGYGKTTLLVDFAVDLEHPVCWYTLDATDCDPRVFVERLIYAIQHRFPGFGETSLQYLANNPNVKQGAPGLLKTLVNEMVEKIPEWFVLVLDDYHHMGEQTEEIDLLVSNFLAYQTDQCLTMIASRSVPDLPLIIQLVAKGGIGGMGLEELRFAADEIQLLFQQNYNIELTDSQADDLAETSEGWITGILLSGTSMWQSALRNLMRSRPSHDAVYTYLAQEVFDNQTDDLQEFLLTSSTLQEMTPQLCQDSLGLTNADLYLETVKDRNLFLNSLEDGKWSRYHNLFRAYLQKRLKDSNAIRWRELHEHAAIWFATQEHYEEAVHHYLTIEAHSEAAHLMAEIVQPLLSGRRLDTLLRWYEVIPESVAIEVPRLLLFQSRAASNLGRSDLALHLTKQAEKGFMQQNDAEGQAYTALQRCQIWLTQGHHQDVVELGSDVLEAIKTTGIPVDYEAYHILGSAYLFIGELSKAMDYLDRALNFAKTQANRIDEVMIRSAYANALWQMGERTQCITMCEVALASARELDNPNTLAALLNDLGFYYYSLGQFQDAFHLFQEALLRTRQAGLRRTEAFVLISLGELTRDLGDYEQAEEFAMDGLRLARELGDRYLVAYSYDSLGLIQRGLHNYPVAINTLNRAIESAEEQQSVYQLGRYEASLGVIWADAGDPTRGLSMLEMANKRLTDIKATIEVDRAQIFHAWACYLKGEVSLAESLLDTVRLEQDQIYEALVIREGTMILPLLSQVAKSAGKKAAIKRVVKRINALPEIAGELMRPSSLHSVENVGRYRIKAFGGSSIGYQGQEIPPSKWGAITSRYLLFYMLYYRQRTRDQIFDTFWSEQTPQHAKASFHTTKFRVKRALNKDAIFFDGQDYMLDPAFDFWFDVAEFERLLSQYKTSRKLENVQAALDLYTGDFLPDCYMEWCNDLRIQLREHCLNAYDELSERLLQRRQYRQAAEVLQRGITTDPIREHFHQSLMRAYALSGRRSQALIQFQRCEELLMREMGISVSQRTRDLNRKITEGKPIN